MDKDHRHYDDVEFSVTIKPTLSRGRLDKSSSPSFRPYNQKLFDDIQSGSWTAAELRYSSHRWQGIPHLAGCSVKVEISDRRANVRISLSPIARDALAKYHEVANAANSKKLEAEALRNKAIGNSYGQSFQNGKYLWVLR